jgi:hypothetical protein
MGAAAPNMKQDMLNVGDSTQEEMQSLLNGLSCAERPEGGDHKVRRWSSAAQPPEQSPNPMADVELIVSTMRTLPVPLQVQCTTFVQQLNPHVMEKDGRSLDLLVLSASELQAFGLFVQQLHGGHDLTTLLK